MLMRKRVVILGATGSIGRSALEVSESLRDEVEVVGIAAQRRWELLAEQARRYRVPHVAIADGACAESLRRECPSGTRVMNGADGLVRLVRETDANFVLAAIVGAAGLPATLAAVDAGIDVGLANKESLVIAGSLIMPLAARRGGALIPVDSEHSAIFQALRAGRREDVRKVYLTASGGPFRTWSTERMESATPDDALRHPTWSMGPKITIDSATMMNKALEIVEARYLFGLEIDQVEVLVHPESIVHSMVEFTDGSLIAQLGAPDMRTPIQYALTHPRRRACPSQAVDWKQARTLAFEPPDPLRFPALRLGFEAARRGGTAPAVLNAANEAAVARFLDGRLGFTQIARVSEVALESHAWSERPTLEALMACDAWARRLVEGFGRC